MRFGAMAAQRISAHRPVRCSAPVPADEQRRAIEYNINFITLLSFVRAERSRITATSPRLRRCLQAYYDTIRTHK